MSKKGHQTLFDLVENLSTPVIGAVNGFALGGGLELAMSCHFRLASDNAKLGLPEVTLGVIPGYGGTQRLAHLVGKGRAMEMIMTAKMITADDALNYGLVNQVTAQEELMAACKKIALKIVKNSPIAIAGAIRAVNAGLLMVLTVLKQKLKNLESVLVQKILKKELQHLLKNEKQNSQVNN